jgi:ABC-2 type transport system ATP-binding protein
MNLQERVVTVPSSTDAVISDSIVDVQGLTKRYAATSAPRGGGAWTESHGPGLWIRNLRRKLTTAKLSEVLALDSIKLQIGRGEVFGLLGHNGAGKTTLVKILAGLIAPSDGDAYVDGISVRDQPHLVKRAVSYVSTTGWMGLEWQLSVRENLLLYARLFGLERSNAARRAEEALAEVGLAEQANQGVHQISHGMRQRLVLARGLLVRTPLVYLDEPTVGLDPVTASDIRRLIKVTINGGRQQTVLLTGHYLPEMDELCDRLAVLHHGRILAIGTPAELKATVADRRVVTLRLGGWRDVVGDDLAALPGVLAISLVALDRGAEAATLRVHVQADGPDLQDLLDALRRRSARVGFASVDPPTLEDAFLALTGGEAR